jgi:hypothetical protein
METKSIHFCLITLSLTFFIFLLLCPIPISSSAITLDNVTKIYTDSRKNFEISYPFDWEIAPKNSTFPYYGETTEVVFRPNGEPLSALDQIIFSISVSNISMSLKSSNQNSSEFLDGLVTERINSFDDPDSIYAGLNVNLVANNYTEIGGNPSRELIFLTQNLGTLDMDIFTIKNGYLYHFVFMSPQSIAQELIPQIQQMKNSFIFR